MIVTVYVKGDNNDEIIMTQDEFQKLMDSINAEIDDAYERGYRDGKNSASTTQVITTPTYANWWENPLCRKNTITCDSSSRLD